MQMPWLRKDDFGEFAGVGPPPPFQPFTKEAEKAEKKILSHLHRLRDEAVSASSEYIDRCKRFYRLYTTGASQDNPEGKTPSKFLRIPYATNVIDNVVAAQVLAKLRPHVIPAEMGDVPAANVADDLLLHYHKRNQREEEEPQLLQEAYINGNAFAKMFYDVSAQDVGWYRIRASSFYIDPLALSMEDPGWVMEEQVRDYEWARMKWPGYDLERDSENLTTEDTWTEHDEGSANREGKVTIREWWVRDRNTTQIVVDETGEPIIDENGEPLRQPMFPYWRIILEVGNKIVVDKPSKYAPVSGWNGLPFVQYKPNPLSNEFYGKSLLSSIEDVQDELNQLETKIARNNTLCGDPKLVIVPTLLVDQGKNIGDETGEIVKAKEDVKAAIAWLSPPPLNPAVFAHRSALLFSMADLTGVTDVSKGQKPTGIQSGVAIQSLQMGANKKRALEALALSAGRRREYRIAMALYAQHWDTPKTIRVVGEGKAQRVRKIVFGDRGEQYPEGVSVLTGDVDIYIEEMPDSPDKDLLDAQRLSQFASQFPPGHPMINAFAAALAKKIKDADLLEEIEKMRKPDIGLATVLADEETKPEARIVILNHMKKMGNDEGAIMQAVNFARERAQQGGEDEPRSA